MTDLGYSFHLQPTGKPRGDAAKQICQHLLAMKKVNRRRKDCHKGGDGKSLADKAFLIFHS